jgi:hypothetical protein
VWKRERRVKVKGVQGGKQQQGRREGKESHLAAFFPLAFPSGFGDYVFFMGCPGLDGSE